MCKEQAVTRFKNLQSFNDLGVMTEFSKDYNHEHGQSTAFDGFRAVMLNIKVFRDVTPCRRVYSYGSTSRHCSYHLPADTALTT